MSVLASAVNGMNVVAIVGHYYAYGFHLFWTVAWIPITATFAALTVVPLLYSLRVSTIFQYLRMRFDNKVGITACIIYFLLSQTLGAIGIYSAAIAISTMLSVPLIYTDIAIGLAGTTYTALGGLRSVVWADCIQAVVMLASPIIIIAKVFYDSYHVSQPLRPLSDFNVRKYILLDDFDVTTDENMWTSLVACIPYSLVRVSYDQMSVQRFMAARTARGAKRIAIGGGLMMLVFFVLVGFTGIAVIYWYRDCDPLLSGAISNYDQIIPYYIRESLSDVKTLRGLFLAGILSASTSTVSSVVNSHAATIYMDIVAPHFDLSKRSAVVLMRILAFASGVIMTLFAIAVPMMGSATRLFVAFYSSASGPFAGLVLLAISSPWVKAKAAAWASLLVCGLQLWHAIGRSLSGISTPPILYGTLDRCPLPTNSTDGTDIPVSPNAFSHERSNIFPLYQLSSFSISFLGALLTMLLGTIFSIAKGKDIELQKNIHLTSPAFLKIWCRFKCLRRALNLDQNVPMTGVFSSCDQDEDDCVEFETDLLNTEEKRTKERS
ncbi:sodium-coupled monocarboxylate transporter 2-like [Dermacentor variabilis]|uniref:sodium-coupled monocarboxylate transporter 2-like n=1 Tax=Dermacentor variabilis TaxID=34621 RepID=UPI003F5B3DD9